MKILFINACVRENSRTLGLCRYFLERFSAEVDEINLQKEALMPFNSDMLKRRDADISNKNFQKPEYRFAHKFAEADLILIGAPYWDLSFPSSLKVFFEHIFVNGLTFYYTKSGEPKSNCKANKLVYITTAGGYIGEANSGERYISDVCKMFKIPQIQFIRAEGLDIYGNDVEKILEDTKGRIEKISEIL